MEKRLLFLLGMIYLIYKFLVEWRISMNEKISRIRLSGNALKMIAAVLMVIDHLGYFLFPQYIILRILGRLSYPIFAFMIGEGCYYTRNKWRYFFCIYGLAVAYQIFNYFVVHDTTMCVLVTFSIAILFVYLLQFLKEHLFFQGSFGKNFLAGVLLLLGVAGVYLLNRIYSIDFGFWGCLLPAFACGLKPPKTAVDSPLKKFDRHPIHVFLFGIGLFFLSVAAKWVQMYCLLALPLLLVYSGERGKMKMKLFFYIFYPVHIGIIYLLGRLFFW